MDVKLRRDERCLHIEIPDGMGISLQFSKQSKLKNDEAIDIFSDSSCTTLVHSVRKPLYPITLTHSSIWIRFKQQNFRNSSVDSGGNFSGIAIGANNEVCVLVNVASS